MRSLLKYAALLLLGTAPGFSQNAVLTAGATPIPATASPGGVPLSVPIPAAANAPAASAASSTPVDLSGFRDKIAEKNKKLNDQVGAEKNIVHKNEAIIQDAKRIDAANKKLIAQRKLLEARNAELDRERQAMLEDEKASDSK